MLNITPSLVSNKNGLACTIASVLDEKLAENIKILYVEEQTVLCSYFIICEGRATTHVKALADELEDKLKNASSAPLHIEGMEEGNWVVLDFGSVIVHIFDKKDREFYNLEKLWRDGKEIPLEDALKFNID